MLMFAKFLLTSACIGAIVNVAAADHNDTDCKLKGTYKFDSDPNDKNLEKFQKTIGFTDDQIRGVQALAAAPAEKTVSYADGKMTVKVSGKGKEISNTFENGKEFSEICITGETVQTIPTIETSKLTLVRKMKVGNVTEVFKCEVEGCTATFTLKGSKETAQIKWKRVGKV